MIVDILKRATTGIAYAGIFTFIALTILMLNDIEAPVSVIWFHMLGSIIIGIYFGLISFIFDKPNWTPLQKTVVHLIISIIGYFSVALAFGWLPFTLLSILFSSIIFLLIYFLYWMGYWLYYKKIEADMNDQLRKNTETNP